MKVTVRKTPKKITINLTLSTQRDVQIYKAIINNLSIVSTIEGTELGFDEVLSVVKKLDLSTHK